MLTDEDYKSLRRFDFVWVESDKLDAPKKGFLDVCNGCSQLWEVKIPLAENEMIVWQATPERFRAVVSLTESYKKKGE